MRIGGGKIWARRLVGTLVLACATGIAGEETLLPATDLAADAARSVVTGEAILVFYKSESCPYCRQVEELYLEPMQQRGSYAGKLVVRVVDIDRGTPLRDFSGAATDHRRFARRQGASFTPLIQIYGADGAVLTPPLVGYTSADFYAGQLEDRIDHAIGRLRPAAVAVPTAATPATTAPSASPPTGYAPSGAPTRYVGG